jgi:23S rRNA (adenine2030-N6)-methyltransferase
VNAGSTSDYSHRFHAGNHADVWKHVVLLGWLDAVRSENPAFLDTHAGEGQYRLGPTGEWTEGVGRFEGTEASDPLVRRWWEAVRRLRIGRGYPGSPVLAVDVLGPEKATFCEIQPDAAAALEKVVRVHRGDGYAALRAFDPAGPGIVHLDPAYTRKEEWAEAADAISAAMRRRPDLRFALWYPVKSWSRPNMLHARLRDAGVAATALDLVVTPLELKRNALAGSGMLLVRPPEGLVGRCAAAAAEVGPRCATHATQWWLRVSSW